MISMRSIVVVAAMTVVVQAFRPATRTVVAQAFRPAVADLNIRTTTAAETPTFARDVAPIVYDHCAVCHRPGQAAPFPLLSYDDVKKRGELIVRVTARRYMPPWHANVAPGFAEFRDDRRLSDAELTTLQAWVDGGMPAGDLAPAPQPPTFSEGWALGRPDVVLTLTRAIEVPADGPDLYRNVVLPLDLGRRQMDHGHRFRAERPQGGPPRVVLPESGGRLRQHSRQRSAARPRRRNPRRIRARAPDGRRPAGRRRSRRRRNRRLGAGHDAAVLSRRHRAAASRAHERRRPAASASVRQGRARAGPAGDLLRETAAGQVAHCRCRCRRSSASRWASTFPPVRRATRSTTRSCCRSTSRRSARAVTRTTSRKR